MKTSFTWCLAILWIALLAASSAALAVPPPERPAILDVDADFGPAGFAHYAVIELVDLHRNPLPPNLPIVQPFDPDQGGEQHLDGATVVTGTGKAVGVASAGLGGGGGILASMASAADMPPRRVEAPQLRSELEAVRRALGL